MSITLTPAIKVYEQFQDALSRKEVNYTADNMRVLLFTDAYTPNQATDKYLDLARAAEISGTGYATNGVALGSPTSTNLGLVQTYNGNTVSWSGSLTARYAVLVDYSPATDATRPMVAYMDFGSMQAFTSLEIDWPVGGIFTSTVS